MSAVALPPVILREYDIRGIVGDTLTEDVARTIGRAFGTVRRRAGDLSVAVGYDGRLSSPSLANALAEGLASCGLEVVEIGLGPTPMLYFAVHHWGLGGGVMVTGSHNPPDYNGFKMMGPGTPVFGPQIQDLGEIASRGDFETGSGRRETRAVFDAYVDRLAEEGAGIAPLTVAWDAGNGAAGEAMRALTARLPGTHHLLFDRIDGHFPNHHPDPTVAENLRDLTALVAEKGCDLGIAFDGDADRIGVVDAEGEILWGDQLLLYLSREVLAARPGAAIIADVKASQTLFDGVAALGGEPVMWRTGHSLIKTRMKEIGAPLAGEMSGHVFFADRYFGFDDALYAAVRLLRALSVSGETLADFRRSLPPMRNTPEIRVDCPEERKFAVVEDLKRALAAEGADANTIDGVRVRTRDGWWLLRASNTQPVLVARCESDTEAGLDRLKAAVRERLVAHGLATEALT